MGVGLWCGGAGARARSAQAGLLDPRHNRPTPLVRPQVELCANPLNHDWAQCPFAHVKVRPMGTRVRQSASACGAVGRTAASAAAGVALAGGLQSQ